MSNTQQIPEDQVCVPEFGALVLKFNHQPRTGRSWLIHGAPVFIACVVAGLWGMVAFEEGNLGPLNLVVPILLLCLFELPLLPFVLLDRRVRNTQTLVCAAGVVQRIGQRVHSAVKWDELKCVYEHEQTQDNLRYPVLVSKNGETLTFKNLPSSQADQVWEILDAEYFQVNYHEAVKKLKDGMTLDFGEISLSLSGFIIGRRKLPLSSVTGIYEFQVRAGGNRYTRFNIVEKGKLQPHTMPISKIQDYRVFCKLALMLVPEEKES